MIANDAKLFENSTKTISNKAKYKSESTHKKISKPQNSVMKKYFIHKTEDSIAPENVWRKAILLQDFSLPWKSEKPQVTSFRALYDDNYLYLRYDVKDDGILINLKTGKKQDVINSDRVEIFFRTNDKLDQYYCLEIDPNGLVLDYSAKYYREFDFSWAWPKKHLFVKANLNHDGYRVDVKISLESLQNLGLLHDNIIEAGIFRGDCIRLPTEGETSANIKWISWVKPKTKTPDFHVPSSFGILELKK